MKQYIAATALCLMAVSPIFAQTKRVMTVTTKDGKQVEYKVNSVKNVTFTEVELQTLRNQVAFGDDLVGISRVTMLQTETSNVFNIYAAATDDAEAQSEAAPVLTITVPQALMGETLTLGSEEAEGVKVAFNGEEQALTGTLQVRLNQNRAIITLESETADYTDLRCKYNTIYTQVYDASNTVVVSNVGKTDSFGVVSALVLNPSETGAATTFAFSDAEATAGKDMLNGKVGVVVGISASKLYNGTIDMAEEADSYTFKYIDYASRIVYDKVKAGTITTAQNGEGKLYIKINATMDDNRTVELEYFGTTSEVESLDDITPAPVADNGYKYYNSDGEVSMDKTLGTSYIDEYKGNYTFYFVPEGETKYSSDKVTLKVSADLINAGDISIADLGDTSIFDLKFKSIGLQSTAAGHGYGNTPNNGTLSISKSEDGVYVVSLEIVNLYKSPWGGNIAGDNTKLVLKFNGTLEAY